MALFKAFVIVDSKMDSFHVPFFAPTDGAAIRQFKDVFDSAGSLIAKYPADFTLIVIGTFDSGSGTLTPFVEFYDLGNATQFVSQASPDIGFNPSGSPSGPAFTVEPGSVSA